MKIALGALRAVIVESYSFLLVEGRVEDAREKYPDMEDENFDFLVANQPAGSNNKYLMWSCKQADALLDADPDPQGLRIVTQAVRLFDGNKQRLEKKDLNQYADVAEIETAVAKLGGASKNQQAKKARADTDTIYSDDKFTVLRPHTTEASCKYGVGTRWCIAATASQNYFHSYSSSNNKFYFVIDKQQPVNARDSKFAIVIQNRVTNESEAHIQVFNALDHQVGLQAVKRHCGEKWEAIWTKIKEHVTSQPDTREVEDARKAVEEHVENLLKGENVSKAGIHKIARDAPLSNLIIAALIKHMKEYKGEAGYADERASIISTLSLRAGELTPEGALALIKYVPETKPAGDAYWPARYSFEVLIKNAPLLPESFRELAATGGDDTLKLILRNPNCPDDIVERLANRLSQLHDSELKRNIRRALIKKGIITADQMRAAMASDEGQSYGSLGYEILRDPAMADKLSPELLRMIPIDSGDDLQRFLSLPNVTPDIIADYISQHWQKLQRPQLYELLKTVNIPVEMIERLWSGKDQHIRTALLTNPAIGVENAKKFATSRNSAYRFAVAHNTVLPPEDLKELAKDESTSTRAAVAANVSTPPETLTALASDEATAVRASVASNAKTPLLTLKALKRDSDEFVRKAVRQTLKSLETVETFIAIAMGMRGHLLKEELEDEDMQDIMTPDWREIPSRNRNFRTIVTVQEFVAIFLLQNNGSATKEEIEAAFGIWPDRVSTVNKGRSRRRTEPRDVWKIIRDNEKYVRDNDPTARGTTAQGKGWFWSPPGINKGSIFRLTPTGAAAAMSALQRVRENFPNKQFTTRAASPVKKSPPSPDLMPRPATQPAGAAAARGPKTTYKIYGRFKGHPVSTRLKGQAYVGPQDTQFAPGEQAIISMNDDGKLKVKKADGDHSQDWDPIDG